MYYMQVLSVPSLCNEGIVNIQVLCLFIQLEHEGIVNDTGNTFIFKLKEHWSLA